MTAFKDLWRRPQHNNRANIRMKKTPPRFNDFGSLGGPLRQTVRATVPGMPKFRSR